MRLFAIFYGYLDIREGDAASGQPVVLQVGCPQLYTQFVEVLFADGKFLCHTHMAPIREQLVQGFAVMLSGVAGEVDEEVGTLFRRQPFRQGGVSLQRDTDKTVPRPAS